MYGWDPEAESVFRFRNGGAFVDSVCDNPIMIIAGSDHRIHVPAHIFMTNVGKSFALEVFLRRK